MDWTVDSRDYFRLVKHTKDRVRNETYNSCVVACKQRRSNLLFSFLVYAISFQDTSNTSILHYSLLCKKLWEDFRRWTVLLVLWIFDSLFDRRWNRIGCIVQYHLDRISFSYISLFLEIEDAFNSGKFVFDFSIWSLQDREENRNNFCQFFIYYFFFLDKI